MPYARGVRLGKRPGTVQDERTLRFAALATPELPAPTKTWRIAKAFHDWPMYGNDRYGDCGSASLNGHRVIAQEWSASQRDPLGPPTEAQVVDAYWRITGGIDSGIYLIDGLKDARRFGVGRENDGTPHTITAYARVDHANRDEVRTAARLFGGLYLGLALPETAEREIAADKPWAATTGPGSELYSWGGHAVWLIEYDERRARVATWGGEQWMTWAWWDRFVDEAWAVVSEDQFNRLGRTPQGLDVPALEQFLARL
jgi:hypothetical protein